MPKRISRRALDFAEIRRQQAEDDKRIGARADKTSEYPLLREWLGLDVSGTGEDGWRITPGLEELEDAYWDLIQWGFAKDRRGRTYDRYADVASNYGPDREFDEYPYGDEDVWDDDSDDRRNNYGDEFGLGDAYDWYDDYQRYLDHARDTTEAYRAWIARSSSPVEDHDAAANDETARSSVRYVTKGLVPDIKRDEQLRMLARRVSKSWKDKTSVAKPWMRKAS